LASSPVISLHPLAVIGFVTFLVNALQLLPIGRLDGGRVATAVLGGGQASPVTCL
jgi:membrane-associated protease RseP (regulator of RpoE activity)